MSFGAGLTNPGPPPLTPRPRGIGAGGIGGTGLGIGGGGGGGGSNYNPFTALSSMFGGMSSGGQQSYAGSPADPGYTGPRPGGGGGGGNTTGSGGNYGGGNFNYVVNNPPPPRVNPYQMSTSYDPNMQSVFNNAQNWQQGMAANQDLAAQHAMQRQRASNSGMLKELGGATLLQQGAGGNRGQQIRNAAFSGQQTMAGLNAGLADSARSQQANAFGMLGGMAQGLGANQIANNQLGLQAQGQAYGQQFQNWQAPLQLQQQGQSLNLQAQNQANQAAYQQAVLQQQAQQMNQQNYWNALQAMMRFV